MFDAVVVAPLDNEEYIEAMNKLAALRKEGFVIVQRNLVFMGTAPLAVYWLEIPAEVNHELPTINLACNCGCHSGVLDGDIGIPSRRERRPPAPAVRPQLPSL